jgi:hypothetical protein
MTIQPGIVVKDYYGNKTTIYPTGAEWILAFALKGCQWAIDEIESGRLQQAQDSLWEGENI